MKINNITNHSFKGLFEPDKNKYTNRQEKLAGRVREILKSTNPTDKKGRDYINYYKNEFGLDLYIKTNNKDKKSIDIFSYDKKNEIYEHLYNYKNNIPKEQDFRMLTCYFKEQIDDFFEKIITITTVSILAGLMFWASNKTNSAQALEKINKTEILQNANAIKNTISLAIRK